MKKTIMAILTTVIMVGAVPTQADDNSIMFEVGWRFDNTKKTSSLIDFGAVRLRSVDAEVHVSGWDDSFAVGVGYTLHSDYDSDYYVEFTPGIAFVTKDMGVRAYYRAAVGGEYNDTTDLQLAQTAYMPLTDIGVGHGDAFVTVAVSLKDDDDSSDNLPGKRGKDGEDGSDGQDGKDGKDGKDGNDGKDGKDGKDGVDGQDGDDGDDGEQEVTCKPGYGHGDTNHCHSGPPGLK